MWKWPSTQILLHRPEQRTQRCKRRLWLQSLPLDADALVLVALSCYHHVSLVQNKHLDLLGVNELQLGAPVQDGPGGANDNLLTDLLTSVHCGKDMFSSGIPKESQLSTLRHFVAILYLILMIFCYYFKESLDATIISNGHI